MSPRKDPGQTAPNSPLAALEAEVRRIGPVPGEASISEIFLGRRFAAQGRREAERARAGTWSHLERQAKRSRAA